MLCLYTVTSKSQTRHIHLKLKGQDVYYFELHKCGPREDITLLKLGRVIFSIISSWSSSAVFLSIHCKQQVLESSAGEGCIYCWCMWCYFKQFHHHHTWKWLDRSLLTEQWFSALLGLQSVYSSQRRRGRLTYVRITFEISECPPFMYLKNYLL